MSPEDPAGGPAAIRVESLSKRYRLGVVESRNDTLAGAVADLLRAPLRNLRTLRSLTRFAAEDGADVIWALRDVSFAVAPGEVVGVIGRNGAGKSTLLKILSRITEPTAGRAVIQGRVASLLEVGTGFHSELTGRENVYLNGTILGMRKGEIDDKFDEIIAFAEVERFVDTPVKRYSSGMKVRLAFAVAAHLEPEILLVDEVLAVGDVAFQRRCLGKMSEVATAGRTVLFVSHQLGAVRRLCPRCLLLQAGRLRADGATHDVVNTYLEDIGSGEDAAVELPAGQPDAPGRGVRLEILDQRSQQRATFRLGETIRLRLTLRMDRVTESVIAAVGVLTADSVPVITFWSEPQDLQPGDYQLDFEPDVRLAAGIYQFAIGLSSHEQAFYRNSPAVTLIVSDAATGEQPVRASGAGLVISSRRPAIARIGAGEPVLSP